jgi:hypothetical protein
MTYVCFPLLLLLVVIAGQPFYPASWTNEDIWRALLGLQPLPSELIDIVGQAAAGEKAYMKKVGPCNGHC